MKKLKNIMRLLRLILIITVTAIGIGLAGGVPLQITHKRESKEYAVEWVMSFEEEPESLQNKIRQSTNNSTIKS